VRHSDLSQFQEALGDLVLCIEMPNKGINRSAEQLRSARCSVPVALRAPAPGYAQRWAS
jgi:hypothetical protein